MAIPTRTPGQDIASKVAAAVAARFRKEFRENVGIEQIIAHGGKCAGRVGCERRRPFRFFLKFPDSAVAAGDDDAEGRGPFDRHRNCCDADIGVASPVKADHLADIHAVDMIGGENRHQIRFVTIDQMEILVYGVGGALEAPVCSRKDHLQHVVFPVEVRRPTGGEVIDQRMGLVLRQHIDRGHS